MLTFFRCLSKICFLVDDCFFLFSSTFKVKIIKKLVEKVPAFLTSFKKEMFGSGWVGQMEQRPDTERLWV